MSSETVLSDTAIRIDGLGKRYRLGRVREQFKGLHGYKTLRETLSASALEMVRGVGFLLSRNGRPSAPDNFIWALKDVSLDIQRGEALGIIGGNGAGKSTLLKILSRITKPTTGVVEIRGRVGSLLEVGIGFHPELTGRENIYLNGAILGMKFREVQRKFDQIVDFAEVAQFIDTPVKHYSSGMYLRLAFAVAAHLEPEILVIDEVLAVGDAAFQKKCLGKMGDVAQEGRTVLFVSHNMAAIRALCSTTVLLEAGSIVCRGDPSHCIAQYEMRSSQALGSAWSQPGYRGGRLVITHIQASLKGQQPSLELELEVVLESRSKHKPAFLAVDILASSRAPLMQALPQLDGFLTDAKQQHVVNLTIRLPPLIPGQYLATVWVGSHNTETLDEVREAVCFEVSESPTPGRSFPHTNNHGYIVPPSSARYHGP
jgi:lipopolysaccharide transport system ATP-binding protein